MSGGTTDTPAFKPVKMKLRAGLNPASPTNIQMAEWKTHSVSHMLTGELHTDMESKRDYEVSSA